LSKCIIYISVPLAQQYVKMGNGTQRPLSGPLAHQSFNETHLSTDLNTPKDITDGTSLTLIHTSDQDINSVDNSNARKKKVHKKSQHFTARNLDNTSSSESISYEY
jgi:hypothetical protein